MPGDGITDVAPIAQLQQQALPLKPSAFDLRVFDFRASWQAQDGWLYSVTLANRTAQLAGIVSQQSQLFLPRPAQISSVLITWDAQQGWMVQAPLITVQVPLWPVMHSQWQQEGIPRRAPTFPFAYASWTAGEGWLQPATIPVVQANMPGILQLLQSFVLPLPRQGIDLTLLRGTPDDAWISQFQIAPIVAYSTAMFAAMQSLAAASMPPVRPPTGFTQFQPLLLIGYQPAIVTTSSTGIGIPPVIILQVPGPVVLRSHLSLAELVNRVSLKLGEQNLFYVPAEIIRGGLDPAQRLLSLRYPDLLTQRALIAFLAEQAFVDLRQTTPRIRRVTRVVLGDVTGDAPLRVASTGELHDLTPTSIARLASQEDWFAQRGETKNWYLWGQFWLGLYKRPLDTLSVTVIFQATPTPFDANTPDQVPDIATVHHVTIGDLATALLLAKEGSPQSERGWQAIQRILRLKLPSP